jgi:hypothetical protein
MALVGHSMIRLPAVLLTLLVICGSPAAAQQDVGRSAGAQQQNVSSPAAAQQQDAGGGDAAQRFDKHVAPLLAARCLDCHSGAEPKGGLDLSRRESTHNGGDSGPVIVAGDAANSLLWQLVEADEMPPKHPLAAAEKQLLRDWIASGAAWGGDPIDRFRFSTAARAGYDWWSLQPVVRPPRPNVSDTNWPRNAVDYFVLAELEARGLHPSADAEPRVLVRRLYYDLLGLPPPPEVVARFAQAPSDVAYAALVEELLASPHYGERWARHWLDIVRFGESDGFERNMPRENAWPYRDWVIQAFNADMPYDEFARQQLAGDALHSDQISARHATGFLVAGAHNTVVANNDLARQTARHEELEDTLAVIGQTFLGLTVQCARCHDHKFDPIPQRDYYQLVAAIDGVQHGERVVESDAGRRQREQRLTELRRESEQLSRDVSLLESRGRSRALAQRATSGQPRPALLVEPQARWSFEDDAQDRVGTLHGELHGGATIAEGRLQLNGQDAFLLTPPLSANVGEKTLEAWVALANLEQRGGGVLSLETNDGTVFDAVVYGEREAKRWMAGSNTFVRTRDLEAAEESTIAPDLVHIAAVYQADGTIALYRNGSAYGKPYRPPGAAGELQPFAAGQARLLMGKRHTGGGNPWFAGAVAEARLYDRALTPAQIAHSSELGADADGVSRTEILAALTSDERSERERLVERQISVQQLIQQAGQTPKAYVVNSRQPAPTHLLSRGDVRLPLEQVLPAGLRALSAHDLGLAADADDATRRKALAEWITSDANPLFRRVIVNRLWHYHFGSGIVDTPSDFGFNGGRPSHPELLDWLAVELFEQKYSLKAIHRHIVLSRTYRQSSRFDAESAKVDAENRLLWRKSPMRVDAETLRDALLLVSGQLNAQPFGPGYHDVRTYYNNGTTYFEPLDVTGPEFARRTIYRFSPRGERSTLLDSFDCPDTSVSTPRRQVTTTPLQALALLNNAFAMRSAEQLAARVDREVGGGADSTERARVVGAYQLALQRAPEEQEVRRSQELVSQHGLPALCRALLNSGEFVVIE